MTTFSTESFTTTTKIIEQILIHPEDSNSNNNSNNVREDKSSIKEYQDILNMLADDNNITYNYALYETFRLMESLNGRPKEEINEEIVKDFVSKAAVHLSNIKWIHYGKSTARLELILHTMSSVLHILSQFISMVDVDTRTSLYKSVSKFWEIYRNTNYINANIMFTLREIRTCLRKIKDDQSAAGMLMRQGPKFIDVVIRALQSEYLAAFGSLVSALNFEYAAGEWYFDWEDIREKYFVLRQQSLKNDKEIKRFYKKLYKLTIKEFEKVERKDTKYRNFEYKMLKSGGVMIGSSLPDHIDTLLIGYLHLIQRILEDFFPQLKRHIKEIVSFCNKIIETNVKKQLTFKAVEILYVIKENRENEEIKDEVK
ncbi:hypothetical protein C1645_841547 [Glomus cerebriforme]|uniref:Uncharacterized protein n=1 Tax=Glomus cerebriforme TaxID=658196 RepID=A0A397S2Z1_9GLOM|nr:hypothetical protein C1645_841547 [Glomus cerebriforme]